jgi:hypothetical protein
MARCDDDGRHNGDSTAMGINGRSDGNLKAVDGLTAMDSSSTVMDGAARRQWTARRLVDGDGWRDGSLMAMYGEGQRERDGNGLRSQW